MALPEKLYTLRKKSGLSQEQLAEALNVSRQAISKWEGGSATPESDKLLALSNYFGVSLDYLLKDGAPDAAPAEAQDEHRTMRLLSLILCFGGAAALIVYGVLSILVPSVPAQISGSSMIRIDGSGIFLLLCVAAIAAGAALLLLSDLVARVVIMPVILPIGALTAFLGGPLFLYLLFKGRRQT